MLTVLGLLATLVIIFMSAALRGDWMVAVVHFAKHLGYLSSTNHSDVTADSTFVGEKHTADMTDVLWYVTASLSVSLISFYLFGGFLHWHFYFQRRDQASQWKCQPDRWLTKENQRHEFVLGSINMAIGGTISGVIACYIVNGGYTTIYYKVSDYGWSYLIFSTVCHYIIMDGVQFYAHKAFHIPFLYRTIHKWHHRYHSPTPFSATAMHPIEFLTYQSIMAAPAFIAPLHAVTFVGVLLYGYYYGVLAHSGIMLDAIWPWQPHTIFHDDHHKYFHCNFGFNTKLYDWLHDTLRLETREYSEETFGGKGKTKSY